MNPLPASNNLTLLRNICAMLVLLGHFWFLPMPREQLVLSRFPWADLGVQTFFVISGMLVTASFLQSPSIRIFLTKRLFRVVPLYAVLLLLQAGAMAMMLAGEDRFELQELVRYLFWNGLFLNFIAPDMGGLFAALPAPGINPSLWTLKIELMFYFTLPFLCMAVRRWGMGVLALLFLLSTGFYLSFAESSDALARQFPGQLRFFVIGMAITFFASRLLEPKPSPALVGFLAAAAVLLAVINQFLRVPLFLSLQPVIVGAAVFLTAFRLPVLREPPDLSYGIYLFHGPLIQLSLLAGIYDDSLFFLGLLTSVIIGLAWLASLLIEKPSIRLGKMLTRRMGRTEPWPRPLDNLTLTRIENR